MIKADPRMSNADRLRMMLRKGVPLKECLRWAIVERDMMVDEYRFEKISNRESYTAPAEWGALYLLLDFAIKWLDGARRDYPLVIIIEGVTLLDRRTGDG